MFRRTKSQDSTTPSSSSDADVSEKSAGKGRPTPTRREAEAANKARAKVPRTRKEQAAAQRLARSETSQKMRQAMKTGDERYLPARDRGPVRRFIRDFVDTRFSLIELMFPLLIVTMILGYSGSRYLAGVGNSILIFMIMFVVVDMFLLRFRLRRELARRFPDEPTKGTTYYAIMRALQMKFMRLPKSQVKIGQQLPETYR